MTDRSEGTTGAPVVVAIIGAGAAGSLVATRVLIESSRLGRAVDVHLIDPRSDTARGAAYSTTDPRHLLNVPVKSMTALPEDAEHFRRWLHAHDLPLADCDFAPRRAFGAYLSDTLSSAADAARLGRLTRRRQRVEFIEPVGGCWRLRLSDDSLLEADRVVLAVGQHCDRHHWAPPRLEESPVFVADPWAPGVLEDLDAKLGASNVLCVGTGLTMIDVAMSLDRPWRTIHAVSRNGLLPAHHRSLDRPVMEAPELLTDAPTLAELESIVATHIAKSRARYDDWRPGFDSLRGLTQKLWAGLSLDDRRRFIAEHSRRWETARHRMSPPTAATIARMRSANRLVVHTGRVMGLAAGDIADVVGDDFLTVALDGGRNLRVGAVIDCTGPQPDVTVTPDPLLRCLLDHGLARPGPLDLGLDTDADGRVLGDSPLEAPPLLAIGALRRGTLWETTAIPEIRAQAVTVGRLAATGPANSNGLDRPASSAWAGRPRTMRGATVSVGAQPAGLHDEETR